LVQAFLKKWWVESDFKAIRRRKSKERQHNGQKKGTKEQTTIYKTLHRKLKIDQPIGDLMCSGRVYQRTDSTMTIK